MADGDHAHAAELEERMRKIAGLLAYAGKLGPEIDVLVRAAHDEIEKRLARKDAAAALVADTRASACALVDAVIGDRVYADARPPARTTTTIHAAAIVDYAATLGDGSIERFHFADRLESFTKAIARGEQERIAAEEEIASLDPEVATTEGELAAAEELVREEARARAAAVRALTVGERFVAFFRTIVLWLASLVGQRPAALPEAAAATESVAVVAARTAKDKLSLLRHKRDDAAGRLAQSTERLGKLRADRERYGSERRGAFVEELRKLTDGQGRGADVTELRLEAPCEELPAGIAIVDVPAIAELDGARRAALVTTIDAFVVLTRNADDAPALPSAIASDAGALPVHAFSATRGIDGLRVVLDRILRERPLVNAVRAGLLARRSITHATESNARGVTVLRERIAMLEEQRIAEPDAYRAALLAKVADPITTGANDVGAAALSLLHRSSEQIKGEWKASIEACTDRAAVDAAVSAINERASVRLGEVVEELSAALLHGMQRVADRLKAEMLEELHARHETARRASIADDAAVISMVTSDDFAPIESPLAGALSAFESKRVGLGLGGAAAGALLGTFIVPGIGTAIGAFLGTFAGFLKGVDSLKRDCVATLEACLDDAAAQIKTQLGARHASLVEGIRAALEQSLEVEVDRFRRSIDRMITLERRVLGYEAAKLDKLFALWPMIEEHEARFRELEAPSTRSAGTAQVPPAATATAQAVVRR